MPPGDMRSAPGRRSSVRGPALTLSGTVRRSVRPVAQAARLIQRDVAVGHERAEAGQPHLTAVRVPGEDHVGAEVDELVEHPAVRCVGHAEGCRGRCHVRLQRRRAGRGARRADPTRDARR